MGKVFPLNLKDVEWARVKPGLRIYHGLIGWCWFDEYVEADEYPFKYTYATDVPGRGRLMPNACQLAAPGWHVTKETREQLPKRESLEQPV